MATQDHDQEWDEDGPTVKVDAAELRQLMADDEASPWVPFDDDATVEEEGPSSFSLDMPSLAQLDAATGPAGSARTGQGFAAVGILASGALIGALILFVLTL